VVTAPGAIITAGHGRRAVARRGVVLVDVIVGAVILGVALAVMIGILGRSVSAQAEGEQLEHAADLLDEQLSLVLVRGPDDYASRFPLEGECDPPFQNFRYRLTFNSPPAGRPYEVRAEVSWVSAGRPHVASVATLIAPRLGDEPDPIRQPDAVVERLP
jgi:hypothetical protein